MAADLDALIRLNEAIQSVHANLYPKQFKPRPNPASLRTFFAARLTEIVLAELEGLPVGYVWCEIQSRPETPFSPGRPRLYVHHLSVEPQARRRGVGAALMRYVEQEAIQRGVAEIALDVWEENDEALAFFGTQGFAKLIVTLHKTLETPPPPAC
ncbi:MAG TPA: GNAT family N-acetyltransferase [Roseiarcus sp.]|nr:GNAT family N-acetyltransferase [Roseiarcus sp.]